MKGLQKPQIFDFDAARELKLKMLPADIRPLIAEDAISLTVAQTQNAFTHSYYLSALNYSLTLSTTLTTTLITTTHI